MQDDLMLDAFEALLKHVATPAAIRAIEAGGSSTAAWQALEESGFCDALVAEQHGGAGLDLAAAFSLIEACGTHALPLPMAQTMLARLLLTQAGEEVPAGPIAIATAPLNAPAAPLVLYGAVARWVLLARDGDLLLMDASGAEVTVNDTQSVDAQLAWSSSAFAQPRIRIAGGPDLRSMEAGLLAAQLSGAMRHVFAVSLKHANERTQFGRSIGKFQAIQHQLSVMAEHTTAAHMAARMAFSSASRLPEALPCAVAKARTSEATVIVAAGAHGIHGAIGITEEFDLQLYTRRMHAWRVAAGSESYWNARIGRALIASDCTNVLDFVRHELSPLTHPSRDPQ